MQVELGRRTRRTWAPSAREVGRWAAAALGRRGAGSELTVQIVGTAESRRLNREYRGQDHATNVLSFPAVSVMAMPVRTTPRPLGDLVICAAVLKREAREQHKSARAHWAHLVVHGSLHLIGYDHEHDDQAMRMERREVAILKNLGFPNPYIGRSS
ncbi:MAG: rRNA maturation RNase YbeY [Steroidobacteraceae bacterium]